MESNMESKPVKCLQLKYWRSRQSGANLSLPKFPANREFNRESCKFWGPKNRTSYL